MSLLRGVTLIALAIGAMLVVGVTGSAATTVLPAGDEWEATLNGQFQIESNTFEGACDVSVVTGQVPEDPDHDAPGDPITMDVTPPTFGDCDGEVHLGGVEMGAEMSMQANDSNGNWQLVIDDDGEDIAVKLIVPEAGATVSVDGCGDYVAAPSGAELEGGVWTNGDNSDTDPSTVAFTAAEMELDDSGACLPAATSYTTATYEVADLSAPALPIQVRYNRRRWESAANTAYSGAAEVKSTPETPSRVTFSWTWNSVNHSYSCKWEMAADVSNATEPGEGEVAPNGGSFTDCQDNLTAPCTLGSVQGTWGPLVGIGPNTPWMLRAHRLGLTDVVEIYNLKILVSTSGVGCALPTSWKWTGTLKPEWTNGGANSFATLTNQTGRLLMYNSSPRRWANVTGKLRFTRPMGNLLLIGAP